MSKAAQKTDVATARSWRAAGEIGADLSKKLSAIVEQIDDLDASLWDYIEAGEELDRVSPLAERSDMTPRWRGRPVAARLRQMMDLRMRAFRSATAKPAPHMLDEEGRKFDLVLQRERECIVAFSKPQPEPT